MRYEYGYYDTAAQAECAIEEMLNTGEISEAQAPGIRKLSALCYAVTLDAANMGEAHNGN